MQNNTALAHIYKTTPNSPILCYLNQVPIIIIFMNCTQTHFLSMAKQGFSQWCCICLLWLATLLHIVREKMGPHFPWVCKDNWFSFIQLIQYVFIMHQKRNPILSFFNISYWWKLINIKWNFENYHHPDICSYSHPLVYHHQQNQNSRSQKYFLRSKQNICPISLNDVSAGNQIQKYSYYTLAWNFSPEKQIAFLM